MSQWRVRQVHAIDAALLQGLVAVLRDCVAGGASVSFMSPLTEERAARFWNKVASAVNARTCALLIAEDATGICGTVQVLLDMPDNQPHRADIAKMLVHRRARRQGIGAALLRAAEEAALACGRHLLVLDTVTDLDGARLYERMGWIRVGTIPEYAQFPQGGYCSTTVYYRQLANRP